DDADAVRGARGRAQRAADAFLEAVLVPPETVAAAEPRIDRPLVLGVLLRDRLLEDLLEGDPEALDRRERLGHQCAHTTTRAVTSAFRVATGSRIFQPKLMSWS